MITESQVKYVMHLLRANGFPTTVVGFGHVDLHEFDHVPAGERVHTVVSGMSREDAHSFIENLLTGGSKKDRSAVATRAFIKHRASLAEPACENCGGHECTGCRILDELPGEYECRVAREPQMKMYGLTAFN